MENEAVEFVNSSSGRTGVTVAEPGVYTVSLIVTDGAYYSEYDDVRITVRAPTIRYDGIYKYTVFRGPIDWFLRFYEDGTILWFVPRDVIGEYGTASNETAASALTKSDSEMDIGSYRIIGERIFFSNMPNYREESDWWFGLVKKDQIVIENGGFLSDPVQDVFRFHPVVFPME